MRLKLIFVCLLMLLCLPLFCFNGTGIEWVNSAKAQWVLPEPHHNWIASYIDSTTTHDSIPYVIITSPELAPVFREFADWKYKKGTPTEVMTTSEILAEYSGDSLQIKIRDYLRYRYVNNHTKWVLIGGDDRHVPGMYVMHNDERIFTDFYYACLDYNWNDDGDTLFGETVWGGDTVDAYVDLYMGRIPAKDSNQARIFISKLKAYEIDTTKSEHLTRSFHTSTDIDYTGQDYMSGILMSCLPEYFVKTKVHSEKPKVVQDELLKGYGIITNVGHSQSYDAFLTHYTVDGWPQLGISYKFFDSTSTNGQYSLFINVTCQYGSILHDTCVARSFLFNPDSWGVGYFGTLYENKVSQAEEFYCQILKNIFDSSYTEIGKAISLARDSSQTTWTYSFYMMTRYIYLTSLYFGDPQMHVFTETPKILDIDYRDWLAYDTKPEDFEIAVTSRGEPIDSALVCLSYGEDVYGLGYTDADGKIVFADVDMPPNASGQASLMVSKSNCFTAERSVKIIKYGLAGDANVDNCVNSQDVACLMKYLYAGDGPPAIMERADTDGDCRVDLTDAVYLQAYFHHGGPEPRSGCLQSMAFTKAVPPPDDPVYTDDVIISCKSDGRGQSILSINSLHDLHGIGLTLKSNEQLPIILENLASDVSGLEMFQSQEGDIIRIGLIDMEGIDVLPAGIIDLANLTGEGIEIVDALTIEILDDGSLLKMAPKICGDVRGGRVITFSQNYPNPFNPTTNLSFTLPKESHVTLEIYNLLGQKVRTLADKIYSAGSHTLIWDGRDDSGESLSSGVYFSRFTAGDFTDRKKLILIK